MFGCPCRVCVNVGFCFVRLISPLSVGRLRRLVNQLTHALWGADPFADEGDLGNNQDVGSQQNYIHIRIQQRNGRKTLTTLQGLPTGEIIRSLFRAAALTLEQNMMRRSYSRPSRRYMTIAEFACNGTLVEDEEMGQVIQLQGDQRLKISNFLTENGIDKKTIKLHGFKLDRLL
ncbi:Eukaryotic translation initiation factor eIF [Salix suchowensis]|nr:Eukaryotic translation initiation factor eIF [Salix suchowensis]